MQVYVRTEEPNLKKTWENTKTNNLKYKIIISILCYTSSYCGTNTKAFASKYIRYRKSFIQRLDSGSVTLPVDDHNHHHHHCSTSTTTINRRRTVSWFIFELSALASFLVLINSPSILQNISEASCNVNVTSVCKFLPQSHL